MAVATRLRQRRMNETTLRTVLRNLESMKAEEFCNRWFGLDHLSLEDREAVWQARGHRAKCVELLCEILKKGKTTVDKWGARFEQMPKDCEATLAYADAIRLQLNTAPEELLKLYIAQRLPPKPSS